jgi:hypothetical protein
MRTHNPPHPDQDHAFSCRQDLDESILSPGFFGTQKRRLYRVCLPLGAHANASMLPEPVLGFGYLILSECGAKGRAWPVALASTSQGLVTTSSAGAIKSRRFSETPRTTVALGDCLKMLKGATKQSLTPWSPLFVKIFPGGWS